MKDISNEDAINKCYAICNNISSKSNLWLFGPSGCGKTHLLKAVCNSLNHKKSETFAIYTTAKDISDYICGITENSINSWLNIDFLLIDNFEYLSGRPRTQECFADLISERQKLSKSTIIASLLAPDEFQNFHHALTKQNYVYPVVKLDYPSYRLKKIIAESYLKNNKLKIPVEEQDAFVYEASNIPMLKGLLNHRKHLDDIFEPCITDS